MVDSVVVKESPAVQKDGCEFANKSPCLINTILAESLPDKPDDATKAQTRTTSFEDSVLSFAEDSTMDTPPSGAVFDDFPVVSHVTAVEVCFTLNIIDDVKKNSSEVAFKFEDDADDQLGGNWLSDAKVDDSIFLSPKSSSLFEVDDYDEDIEMLSGVRSVSEEAYDSDSLFGGHSSVFLKYYPARC